MIPVGRPRAPGTRWFTLDGHARRLVSGAAPAGVLFGWSGLAAVPSAVELVALTESEVGQWRGLDVRILAATDPGLALAAIDSMAWSLQQTVERIEGFGSKYSRKPDIATKRRLLTST